MSVSVLVFVVEDEFLIQSLLEVTLQDGGFCAAQASSAEEAIAILDSGTHDYGALITDVNLGGKLNGWDVARRCREINPTIPVVYMTGDSAHEWTAQGVPHSVLIAKPFDPDEVMSAVSQLLTGRSGERPPT